MFDGKTWQDGSQEMASHIPWPPLAPRPPPRPPGPLAPCPLPLVAAPRLSINLAAWANLSGPEDPSCQAVKSNYGVQFTWSGACLCRVGITTYINAPNTNTSLNAAPAWAETTKGRGVTARFRVGAYHCPGVSSRPPSPSPQVSACIPASSHPRRDRRLSPYVVKASPSNLVATHRTQMERNHAQSHHHPAPQPTLRLA